MKKILSFLFLNIICFFFTSAQSGFNGTFNGVVNDVNAVLLITTTNNLVSGEYQEGQDKLSLQGQVLNNEASGEMIDPASGTALSTFYFLLNGNTLNARFSVFGLVDVDAAFTRSTVNNNTQPQSVPTKTNPVSNPSTTNSDANLDPALFGTWMREIITNSGSGSTYSGMTAVRYQTYNPDGTYTLESASAGGGGDWSFSSGGRTLQEQGVWMIKDGLIHVKPENATEYYSMLKHFFNDGNLVYKKTDGTYLIYHR